MNVNALALVAANGHAADAHANEIALNAVPPPALDVDAGSYVAGDDIPVAAAGAADDVAVTRYVDPITAVGPRLGTARVRPNGLMTS